MLKCRRAREEGAVYGVNDRLCADLASSKKSAVEALDGIFATLHLGEFQIDVALGVRIYRNVNHLSVLFVALSSDVVLKFFNPGVPFFSVTLSARV